jgi:GxxExxY protein
MYTKLPQRTEFLAQQAVDIAVNIHKELGPGLLESVYAKCFCFELQQRGIKFETEKHIDIYYRSNLIEHNGLKIDLILEDSLIIELKAQPNQHPVWEAQLLSYLKLTNKRLGLLLNFHVLTMKEGIKRMIL